MKWHSRCRPGVVAALLIVLPVCLPANAGDLVTGGSQVWAHVVQNRAPGTAHTGKAPYSPLVFWMTYRGSESALRYIRAHGHLPIRHRWSVAVRGKTEIEVADEKYVENIPVDIGSGDRNVQTRLNWQLGQQGSFTWRTWSTKKHISRGVWKVDVLYDDDTPVYCDDHGKRRPCSFRIQVGTTRGR